MAVSLVAWSRVLSGICFLISATHVLGLEVGGDPVARPNRDARSNSTTILNQEPVGLNGLVTQLQTYMLNTNDCIRLQVWRPASLSPPSVRGPTTTSSVTPTFPVSVTYWSLVGQTLKCLRGESSNLTFVYDLPADQYIRVERNDVIGFSVRPNNPVPYTVDHTCLGWRHSLSLERMIHPENLMTNIVYSFVPISECRTYSLTTKIVPSDCKKILPISILQNITFVSTGTEDECWNVEPVPSLGTSAPSIIYLKYHKLTFPDCNTGYVEIREGRSSSSPLIQKDCQMPSNLNAELRPITTGAVYIRFRRTSSTGGPVTFSIAHSTERVITPLCRDIVVTETQVYIGSPHYPHHYPPNADICWRLRVNDDASRIRVELGAGIDLQPPVGCKRTERYNTCLDRHCKDFIEVRDGAQKTSPLMTKWCDHTGNDLIETSSGQTMSVYFVSDSMIQGQGFRIKIYSVHPETIQCSHYTAMYLPGAVQSPYYPYQYPLNRDDCWSVKANDRKLRLLFTVRDSYLEDDLVCSKDWVEVRDGPGRTAPLLQRWCGRTLPTPILTSGPYAFVRFVSNSMGRYPGFALSYVQVASEACTEYYAYPHREYLKPDFGQTPSGYDIQCWVIRTELGNMRIQWDSMGTATDVTICGNDYVEIHDGATQEAPKLGRYCDNSPIPPQGVTSTGSVIYILWKSDVNTRPANFRLVYMALSSTHCPLVFAGEQQPLYLSNPLPGMTTTYYPNYFRTTAKPSPGRPQPVERCTTCKYGPNQQSCWTVETERPNGKNLVSVRFVELQERDERGHCKYDFLELRDGQSGDSPLLAMMCGNMEPTNFTTNSRWLFVRFQSDSKIELRGFRLEVKALYGDECEVLGAKNYGTILRSPFYASFPPNTEKCWTIKSPSNQQPIKVSVILSNLDVDDVIEFYDGPSSEAALLQKFDFHTKTGASVISTASTMTLVLRTGPSTTSRGRFDLRYSWLYAGMCNYLPISETPTYLSSRNYGVKDYTSNDYGCWVLTVLDPKHTVELYAESFHLEEDNRCSKDYLEVFDGPKNTDEKLLHRWCGQFDGRLVGRSSGRSLYVVFSSDNKNQFPGFKLKVMSKVTDGSGVSVSVGSSALLSDQMIILVPVICLVVIVLIIVIIAVVCWGRKRSTAAQSETPAPVVVYTNQPPAYTAPHTENGAAGRAPPEENKVALPDDFDAESLPPPTPRVTADTSTLL